MLAMASSFLNAQSTGMITFGNITVDPNTGYSIAPINWEDNEYSNVYAVTIEIAIANAPALCLDEWATKNSVASPFSANDVSISGATVTIFKFNPTLASNSTPLITLYFRAEPSANIQIGAGDVPSIIVTQGTTPIPIAIDDPIDYEMPAAVSISGLVRKAPQPSPGTPESCDGGSNLGIPEINVIFEASTDCFSGFTTNPLEEYSYDGYYQTNHAPPYYKYEITLDKDPGDTACDCGLGEGDIAEAQKFILETSFPATLQQLIAADFNGSGQVSTQDLVNMSQCKIGTFSPPAGWHPWQFVPVSDYNDNNPPSSNYLLPSLPASIVAEISTSNLSNQDFYGIKRGDVMEQECTECGGTDDFTGNDSDDRAVIPTMDIHMSTPMLTAGVEYILPLRFPKMEGLSVLSLELFYNTGLIEVLDIEKRDATDKDYLIYGSKEAYNTGVLRSVWFTMNPKGEVIAEDETMFNLKVRARKDVASGQSIFWQSSSDKFNNAICDCGRNEKASLRLQTTGTSSDGDFMAKLTGVNPASSITQIAVFMPESATVSLEMFDNQGHLAQQRQIPSVKGWNDIVVSDLPDTPGVYVLYVRSDFGQKILRFIKQ